MCDNRKDVMKVRKDKARLLNSHMQLTTGERRQLHFAYRESNTLSSFPHVTTAFGVYSTAIRTIDVPTPLLIEIVLAREA